MKKLTGITLIFLLLGLPALATPVVSTSSAHRYTADLQVNPDSPEGSILVTITSEEPAEILNPPANLQTLNDHTWELIFPWDDTATRTLQFTDASAETVTVAVAPERVIPFDPTQHQMPALDLRTAAASLWAPDSGLYVFGENENCLQHGSDWERPAQFMFYDGGLSPVINEPVGLRINGGWSRRFNQKGLRFYFDDYGSEDQIQYDFFGDGPTSFQRLILRCALSPRRCFTDVLVSDLYADLGHLSSRWAPVAVYLNGEYWGFQPLRERIDDEFIEHTHGYAGTDYALIKDGETLHGDTSDFWVFLDECRQPGDFSSHQWYLHAAETFDLVSYIDWLLINIYGATTDNGSSYNSAQFRPAGGPWQFITWDEDGLFYTDNYQANYFHFLSINSLEEYNQYLPEAIFTGSAEARISWAAPFRALLQNSEFKRLFAQRYHELMDTWFSETSLDQRLNDIRARQLPEMALHGERWDWPTSSWYQSETGQLFNWFHFRPNLLNPQFDDFMEFHRAPVELVSWTGTYVAEGGVSLQWTTASEEGCLGFVLYRGEDAEQLLPIATFENDEDLVADGAIWTDAHYQWEDENTGADRTYYYQLAWEDAAGTETFLPWVVEVSTAPPFNLKINEFVASNETGIQDETGTCEDWVEIYNAGPGPAPLAGCFLTDDLALPTRWEFPDTTLAAGSFLLVWCDADPEDGPLHAGFKLSAAGETIALLQPVADGNGIIDVRVFGAQSPDVSEGRENDGGENWVFFPMPTPGFSNGSVAQVPGASGLPSAAPMLESVHPNPFNPRTSIVFRLPLAGPVNLDVHGLDGTRVRRLLVRDHLAAGIHTVDWDGTDSRGRCLPSGPYLLRIHGRQGQVVGKVVLLK